MHIVNFVHNTHLHVGFTVAKEKNKNRKNKYVVKSYVEFAVAKTEIYFF